MVSAVSHTTIDSRDAYAQSEWWKQVLGYVDLPDDPNAPGHEECEITAPDRSHTALFIQVPEAKTVKNRIHFDLRPTDRTRDEEVERLRGIGAVEPRRPAPPGRRMGGLRRPGGQRVLRPAVPGRTRRGSRPAELTGPPAGLLAGPPAGLLTEPPAGLLTGPPAGSTPNASRST